jgi:hypothetical protein
MNTNVILIHFLREDRFPHQISHLFSPVAAENMSLKFITGGRAVIAQSV